MRCTVDAEVQEVTDECHKRSSNSDPSSQTVQLNVAKSTSTPFFPPSHGSSLPPVDVFVE